MTDFIEVKTANGAVMVTIDNILFVEETQTGATLTLRSGQLFKVTEPYEDISNFISWVSAGKPPLDDCGECTDECCTDCGEPIEDDIDEEEQKN